MSGASAKNAQSSNKKRVAHATLFLFRQFSGEILLHHFLNRVSVIAATEQVVQFSNRRFCGHILRADRTGIFQRRTGFVGTERHRPAQAL